MADQMAHLFPSTSQPLPSSAICAIPQPSSHSISTSADGMNLNDLMLPPEVAATTKRTTARSHSHLGIPKPNGPSTYARPAMIPKPVPQPLDAARYQPPPMKARARRVPRGKARAVPMPVIAERWDSNGAEHIPPFDPQRCTATQPSRSWTDLAKIISDPTQQSTLSNAELARAVREQPDLSGLPVEFIEGALARLRGAAGENKNGGPSEASAHWHQENPRPVYMDAPRTNMSPVVPPVSVPEMDQPSFSGFFSLTPSPESPPSMAPTTVAVDPPCETQRSPATLNPLWVFEELVQNETTSVATATQETNAEEEHRGALPVVPLFDFDFQFGFEGHMSIPPATYEEIERNLNTIIDQYQSTGVVRGANTNETGTEIASDALAPIWQFIDFSDSV
ncbi:hypothetical protein BC827DRAFT_1242876 [Russula dissimulans]|nr:hypothetical protein BC827DRAFT_1242876 [Russula dissimulans]